MRALPTVTQAQNMIDHEEEIMARPARSWFQTPKQKKAIAEAAKATANGAEAQPGKKGKRGDKNAAAKAKDKKQKGMRKAEVRQPPVVPCKRTRHPEGKRMQRAQAPASSCNRDPAMDEIFEGR